MVAKFNLDDMFNQGLFLSPMNLGDNLEEVRSSICNFKLDETGIDILAFQAGVGKTHHINELLKNKKNYLLVTGSHQLLEGEYKDLKAKHWENFREKCVEYNARVKKLHSSEVPIRYICQIQGCDKRKCPYWKQFNTPKAIAPYHFLTTDRVLDKNHIFKFDMLLVDEAMDYGTNYTINEEVLNESIQSMGKYVDVKFLEEIDWDEDLFDYLQEKNDLINSNKYSALNAAINEKKWTDVKNISQFRPYNLIKYYYYHSIYGNKSSYYEPLLYNVFDLVRQEVPVIMLDASIDINAFEVILARYNFEHKNNPRDLLFNQPLGPLTDLSTMVYGSNIQEKNKIIHRMNKNNFYYRIGFFNNKELTETGKKTVKELKSFINRIKRKYQNVGVITYKDLEPYFTQLETEHFFNLRGSNKFKKIDVLFIIGTPQKAVPDILKGYNQLCLTKFSNKDIYKPTYKNNDGKMCLNHKYEDLIGNKYDYWDCNDGKGYDEKKPISYRIKGDYDLEQTEKIIQQRKDGEIDLELWYEFQDYTQNQDESEKYQTIHRARPFLNDNPIIYIFGDVAEQVKTEFTVKSYDKNETLIHFMGSRPDNMGVYPLVLWHAIIDYFTRTRSTSLEIAKKFNIYKKDKTGYNTPFVTRIIKGISPEDVVKIDKFFKEDLEMTYNKIKRKYRTINMDKALIDDFIFYAREGAFIRL